jgi:hypothetical protein
LRQKMTGTTPTSIVARARCDVDSGFGSSSELRMTEGPGSCRSIFDFESS